MLTMASIFAWLQINDKTAWTSLWIDGSPSSGYEALICVEELVSKTRKWSRTLAITYLGYGYMSLSCKLFSFLWKLWCESLSVPLLRYHLRLYRFVISDFGREAQVADARDCVPEFLEDRCWPPGSCKGGISFAACLVVMRLAPRV